jgi:hypothetical protein
LTSSDGSAQAAAAVALGNLQGNHDVLCERLKSQNGDIPSRAKPLNIDTKKLIGLLSSQYEDEASQVLAAACVQPKLPLDMRSPACAAATTLALLNCADAVQPIESQVTTAKSKEVVASLLASLGTLGGLPDDSCAKIAGMLSESSAMVRAGACLALGGAKVDTSKLAESVALKLNDPHPIVRGAAAVGLSKMKVEGPAYSSKIGSLLEDSIPTVQVSAMKALGNLGEKGEMFAGPICKLALDGETTVKVIACEILSGMGSRGSSFADEITILTQDADASVSTAAKKALAKMGKDI